jgi:hypothetical protein
MSQPDRWPPALRARPVAASGGAAGMDEAGIAVEAASAPDMARGGAIEIVMSVERDPASGKWRVVGDDGSVLEDGFSTAGAARRWIADRSE